MSEHRGSVDTSEQDPEPRAGLPAMVEQLRGMADLLESMTPAKLRSSGPTKRVEP